MGYILVVRLVDMQRRVIRDRTGITHRFEAAAYHNTRCGQALGRRGKGLPVGIVDCMTCLVGPSHLTYIDLLDGVEVVAYVQLLDYFMDKVGMPRPIIFTRGVSKNVVTFDGLPVGVKVYGYSYEDEDGRDLVRNTRAFPGGIILREGDTITIKVGAAVSCLTNA